MAAFADIRMLRLLKDDWARIAAINASTGGWAAAWQHTWEIANSRRVLVQTLAPSADRPQLVLRTRVRLNGDTQTDVCARWLGSTPKPTAEAFIAAHFRDVVVATVAWPAVAALTRLATTLLILAGLAIWPLPALQGFAGGWRGFAAALLPHRWAWTMVPALMIGVLFRVGFRTWLRRRFSRGLI